MLLKIAAGPRQSSHSQLQVPHDHDHILLSQIRDSPNLEGQVPVFISPRNRVVQLYLQGLGFLFCASYESPKICYLVASRSCRTDRVENTASRSERDFFLCCVCNHCYPDKFFTVSYLVTAPYMLQYSGGSNAALKWNTRESGVHRLCSLYQNILFSQPWYLND
jgi:hypothetical protein